MLKRKMESWEIVKEKNDDARESGTNERGLDEKERGKFEREKETKDNAMKKEKGDGIKGR